MKSKPLNNLYPSFSYYTYDADTGLWLQYLTDGYYHLRSAKQLTVAHRNRDTYWTHPKHKARLAKWLARIIYDITESHKYGHHLQPKHHHKQSGRLF